MIGTGQFNEVNDALSGVVAGDRNVINGRHSFVGSGTVNNVSAYHSSIVGGSYNQINIAQAFIGGGYNNIINAAYSAILGGSNNVVGAAYTHAGIFGQGITAVASNTFHVEALYANNIPGPFATPPALPAGTFYWAPPGSLGRALYIV